MVGIYIYIYIYILGTKYFAWKVRKENIKEINDPSVVALKDFV